MGQAGLRLKRHMRETDENVTLCGRRMDELLAAGGIEIWKNGSHIIEVTYRLDDVECEKCKCKF